jgi:hypothetical protein
VPIIDFSIFRNPEYWRLPLRNFPFGAHWPHVAPELTRTIVSTITNAVDGWDVPFRISLKYPTGPKSKTNQLKVFDGEREIYVPLKFSNNLVRVGNDNVVVNNEHGPMLLVNAIVDAVENALPRVNVSES